MIVINDQQPFDAVYCHLSRLFVGIEIDDESGEHRDIVVKQLNVPAIQKKAAESKQDPEDETGAEWLALHDEARLHTPLHHRNIVQAFGLRNIKGKASLVLDHVPGGSLTQRIRQRKFNPPNVLEAVDVLRQLTAACLYIHRGASRSVIHGDICPENVMWDAKGAIKLVDFGLAREIGHAPGLTVPSATAGRYVNGTFSAPELDAELILPSSDLWSLGAVFLFALVGGNPSEDWLGLTGTPFREAFGEDRDIDKAFDAIRSCIFNRFAPEHSSLTELNLAGDEKTTAMNQRRAIADECFALLKSLLEPNPASRRFSDGQQLQSFLIEQTLKKDSCLGKLLLRLEQIDRAGDTAAFFIEETGMDIVSGVPTWPAKELDQNMKDASRAIMAGKDIIRARTLEWDCGACHADYPFLLLSHLHTVIAAIHIHDCAKARSRGDGKASQLEAAEASKHLEQAKIAQDAASNVPYLSAKLLADFCARKRLSRTWDILTSTLTAKSEVMGLHQMINGLKMALTASPLFSLMHMVSEIEGVYEHARKNFEQAAKDDGALLESFSEGMEGLRELRRKNNEVIFRSLMGSR